VSKSLLRRTHVNVRGVAAIVPLRKLISGLGLETGQHRENAALADQRYHGVELLRRAIEVLGHLQAGAERAAQRCEPREGTVARLQGPSTLIAISVLYESNVLYRFTRGPVARRLYWNQVLPPPLAVWPRLSTRHEVVLRPGRHCRTVRRVDGVVQRHIVPRLAQHGGQGLSLLGNLYRGVHELGGPLLSKLLRLGTSTYARFQASALRNM